METDVLEILQNFHSDGLFVAPNIPSKKAKNASACYGMSSSVDIYAIVDSTVFGSAKMVWHLHLKDCFGKMTGQQLLQKTTCRGKS